MLQDLPIHNSVSNNCETFTFICGNILTSHSYRFFFSSYYIPEVVSSTMIFMIEDTSKKKVTELRIYNGQAEVITLMFTVDLLKIYGISVSQMNMYAFRLS